jgi:hypothetical protein
MAVLLLTYDLNNESSGYDYSRFYEIIRKYDHIQLSESSYALVTIQKPENLARALRVFVDKDDSVTVVTLESPFESYSQEVQEWLSQRL